MSLLKSLNRYMERNQAVGKALLEQYEQSTITNMEDFSAALWASIEDSKNEQYLFEVLNHEETPLEFIVKIFVKIGFSCEHAVRLMMKLHKNGSVVLARADEETLLRLQEYINIQASTHDFCVLSRIIKI